MKIKFIAIQFLLFPVTLVAQTQLPDTTYTLDEVVISANKMPELRSKVPQQVQVIPALEVSRLNPQTTADLIGNSGTVTIQKSQQGGGSAQMRGFEASRVLLVVDGVRMNNLIYRAGHLQNMLTVDINSLDGAEIVFGPSSTVYGSDALGGVIHFKTQGPELSDGNNVEFKANAMFRYGTANSEKSTHVDLNLGGKRFGSFTSLSFSDFGDLTMGKKINPGLGEAFGLRKFYAQRSGDNTSDVIVRNHNPHVQKFSAYKQDDINAKITPKKILLSARRTIPPGRKGEDLEIMLKKPI